MTPRTPEERERMYALLWGTAHVGRAPWPRGAGFSRPTYTEQFDRLLHSFPQLWDSLPPDPAETARKEAEEDGMMLAAWRAAPPRYVLSVDTVARFIDRLVSRAAAGYPVLIAPKEES